MFQKSLDEAQAGDNVGILLRGVQKTDIERGMVLAQPGTIEPHKKFIAEVYILTKEEGRDILNSYRDILHNFMCVQLMSLGKLFPLEVMTTNRWKL